MTLSKEVGKSLRAKGKTLAVAESVTGGLVSSKITDEPGASEYFLCGIIAYSNQAKVKELGVSKATLRSHGAVSYQCALEMAKGVRLLAGADLGASCTGIAGPTGATKDKPLGLVYLACVGEGYERMERMIIEGSRLQVKERACDCLLLMVQEAAGVGGDRGRRKGDGE